MPEVIVTHYGPAEADAAVAEKVWRILVDVDNDFVPPLSARDTTTTKTLSIEGDYSTGPRTYFEQLLSQHVLLAEIGENAVGLMSFIAHYDDDILAPYTPSTYVTTIAVLELFRRDGIGSALNDAFDRLPAEVRDLYVSQRTWSTNVSNITLMGKRGFREVARLEDHRGPGVDTIYFVKPVSLEASAKV